MLNGWAEQDNVRASLRWAIDASTPSWRWSCGALHPFWYHWSVE
jgi:hypothetical protein